MIDPRNPFTASFYRQLQQLKIHTTRAMLGSRTGQHLSSRRGQGLEFADYRPYTAGDDFRHIDWGAYGRTDRLYVKQFREERDLNVIVLLDTSASMGFPAGQKKFELARDLALGLGYVALTEGDSVRFALLGVELSQRFRGPRALHSAASLLSRAEAQGSVDIVSEVRAAISRQKLPGKAFFISDFLFDTKEQTKAIDLLVARNFDITVLQVLSPFELKLDANLSGTFVEDAETKEVIELALNQASRTEYARLLAEHISFLETYCRRANIHHVLLSSSESVSDVLLSKLPALGILR